MYPKKTKRATIPEHMLRNVQLVRTEKKYDEEGRELRHASKIWQYAAECWHVENHLDCPKPWNDSEQHICFWCPQHAEERNQTADMNNVRWIPPKRLAVKIQ